RGDRPRRGAGDPADLRRRVEPGADRSAGRVHERPGDHPDGRPGVGPMRRICAAGRRLGPGRATRLVLTIWLLGAVPVAAAADPATFGTPTASSKFGTGIDFVQPVTISGSIARARVLVSPPAGIGPDVRGVPGAATSGSPTLRYHLDLSDGNTAPNTPFTARWRLVAADGTANVAPAVNQISPQH